MANLLLTVLHNAADVLNAVADIANIAAFVILLIRK